MNMATQTTTHPITAEQYEYSFEGHPDFRDELINGRIVMTPQPKPVHQMVGKNIERLLDAACEGTAYEANHDSSIKLSPIDMPAPDVFVVLTKDWDRAMQTGEYLKTPPLLAIEILSPGQNVNEKVHIYLGAGIKAVWVVDPQKHAVTFYEAPEKKPYREVGEVFLPSPLKGSIRVDDIFARVPKEVSE